MYFPILLFVSFISNSYGKMYSSCNHHRDTHNCIKNPLCRWCNISNSTTNITGVCNPNTQCFYNNSNCISNNEFNYVCNVFNVFLVMSLLFIVVACNLYISYNTKKILDKYFDNYKDINDDGIHNNHTYKYREKTLILTIINVLLFVPPLLFWIIDSVAFLYYFICVMSLVSIMYCSFLTKNIYRKPSYTRLN